MQRKRYRKYSATASGGTIEITLRDINEYYTIEGDDITLTSNLTISPDIDANGMPIIIYLTQKITLDGNNLTVFGKTFRGSDYSVIDDSVFLCHYFKNSGAYAPESDTTELDGWKVVMLSAFGIPDDFIATDMIADDSVDNDKLANITRGSIKTGGVSNAPTDLDCKTDGNIVGGDGIDVKSLAVTGDLSASASGSDMEFVIADDAVTNAKLANIVRGSIKTGGVSNAPTDLDCKTDGSVVGGDGTDVKSLAVAGDLSASASGSDMEFTVNKGTLSTASNVSTGIIMAKTVKGATLKSLLDNTTNKLFDINSGDIVLKVVFHTQTAAGTAGVIDIGYNSVAGGGTADSDGLLKGADGNVIGAYGTEDPAGKYLGAQLAFGNWISSAAGEITILSSADLTASSIVAGVTLYYISA